MQPKKTGIMVRLKPEDYGYIKLIAERNDRSLSYIARKAVEQWIANQKQYDIGVVENNTIRKEV